MVIFFMQKQDSAMNFGKPPALFLRSIKRDNSTLYKDTYYT